MWGILQVMASPPPCNCWSRLTNSPSSSETLLRSAIANKDSSPILFSGACNPTSIVADSNQRFQRQIRNRESAARSRARKQACNNELELKISRVMEDNFRLKTQVEELQHRLKSSAKQSKMKTLYRTLTSPF